MKLKTKKSIIEAERRKYEEVAKKVGVTRFERDPHTGQYLDCGTAMDFRIWMGAKNLPIRA